MKTQIVIILTSLLWGLACGVKGDPQPPEKSLERQRLQPDPKVFPSIQKGKVDESQNEEDKEKEHRKW